MDFVNLSSFFEARNATFLSVAEEIHPSVALGKFIPVETYIWKFIHLVRHLTGWLPYRTDFDRCQGSSSVNFSLRIFPGVAVTQSDLWPYLFTIPDIVITRDYISHLTPWGFELMSLVMWVLKSLSYGVCHYTHSHYHYNLYCYLMCYSECAIKWSYIVSHIGSWS